MATREHLARALWTLFEPIHAVTYFSPQSREAFAEVGLTRYWDGYFAGRSAPLGAVSAAPVIALFSGFAPRYVERALPAAWEVASVPSVLEARAKGAAATLRAAFDDESAVARAADALAAVAGAADIIGRPLGAANAGLPLPANPYARLWQAAGTLRELRGDGHVNALVAGEIAGITTLVLRTGVDLDAATMQKGRGWTDEEWAVERAALIERGLLDQDARITRAGAAKLNEAEHLTNKLAAEPWARLSDGELLEVARLLSPIAKSVGELFPIPNLIGMPRSWDPVTDPEASSVPEVPALP
jgi:hypothetical protein